MARSTHVDYRCDDCGNGLPSSKNTLAIVTEKNSSSLGWSRLRVKIEHRYGSQSHGEMEDAELCQSCAIKLLEDALRRVKLGERATKGSESVYEGRWIEE